MSDTPPDAFDEHCTRCPRLADFLAGVRRDHPDYHARPVAPFGAARPKLLIVGLAPGMHGANRTGRPFTGDHAGILLYQTLHEFGFANRPESVALDDGFRLKQCRITNAVKCLPPANKPTGEEIRTCNDFLAREIAALPKHTVILALGSIAHNAVVRATGGRASQYRFGHGAEHTLADGHRLIDSYHCSRYNTQTRRLTEKMFHDVFRRIRKMVGN